MLNKKFDFYLPIIIFTIHLTNILIYLLIKNRYCIYTTYIIFYFNLIINFNIYCFHQVILLPLLLHQ